MSTPTAVNPTSTATAAYVVARDLDDALARLAAEPRSLLACGATVLLPRLAHDHRPPPVIDVAGLAGFTDVLVDDDGRVRLGPAVTYSALLRRSDTVPTLLRRVAGRITGGPQIRNQGTVGGSVCYANPASDVPTALVALGASLTVAGPDGQRDVAAADFVTGAFTTVLRPGELLVGIAVPPSSGRWGYSKLLTGSGGWPVATAAAHLDGNRAVVTVGSVTTRPVTLPPVDLEDPADPTPADHAALRAVLDAALSAGRAHWWSDELAEATYRRRVAVPVAARAVRDAITREPTP